MSHISTTPDHDLQARYERAQLLQDAVFNKKVAFNTTLYPHWIGDSDTFWYVRESRDGQTYRVVDAKAGTNSPAFDHEALAQSLNEAADKQVAADALPLLDLDLRQAPQVIVFSAFGQRWLYDSTSQRCEAVESSAAKEKLSPDGKQCAFVRAHNLWVRDCASGEEKALTFDGERFNEYAASQPMLSHGLHNASVSLEVLWSADSKRLFTVVIDTREVAVGPPLVQHVPTDGSLRPKILRADRRVAFPDDEHIPAYQLLAIEVDTGAIQRADYRPCPIMYPAYAGYFTGGRGWWGGNSRYAYFIDHERGGKTLNVVKFDTHTGTTEVIITETSDTAVKLIPISHHHTLVMPLPNTNELIWFSERSGWAHFYLYTLDSGQLKNTITQGEWLVRNILHFDSERRELWIQTASREPNRNPYYCDICRVNIDSGELTPVISSDHEYIVCDQASRISIRRPNAMGVSPSGRYVATTRSRADTVPVSLLLDRGGNECLMLETADVSGLPDNWQWPEPVMLKAADGSTPISGVVFRPSDFDPNQSYPVLDGSFAYVSAIGSFSNGHTGNMIYLQAAAYAELGFIVVLIHNRGKDGLRDRAFSEYQSPNFPEPPLLSVRSPKTDCVAGIQQLAQRYPYMDLKRVGVIEFCSQPNALAGMLVHPDFYTVGVSTFSCADSRVFNAHGRLPVADDQHHYEDLAVHLQGKLLITTGMMEWVMPVATTFRLIEALQKANKRFDMLILPNLCHGYNSYVIQRCWDYVVEHLQGCTPPKDFVLTTSWDRVMASELKGLEDQPAD